MSKIKDEFNEEKVNCITDNYITLGVALKIISERVTELKEQSDYAEIQNKVISAWDAYSQNAMFELLCKQFETVSDEAKEHSEKISDLKKRIKYAKTPMERQMLNKRLNELYKRRRKPVNVDDK